MGAAAWWLDIPHSGQRVHGARHTCQGHSCPCRDFAVRAHPADLYVQASDGWDRPIIEFAKRKKTKQGGTHQDGHTFKGAHTISPREIRRKEIGNQ